MQTLYKYISTASQKQHHSDALLRCDIEGRIEEKISYKELQDKIVDTASWLLDQGLRPSDVICIAMVNSPEFLIVSWAAWGIGIVTVPLDLKRGTLEEHLYKVKVSRVKLIVAQQGVFTRKEKLAFGKVHVVEIQDINFNNKRNNIPWKQGVSHQALILFTSGTTAHPKGALLSLGNLIVNAISIKDWFKITKDDRFMVTLPLHHINSTSFCLAMLLAGGSIAIVPTYSNSRFWQHAALTKSTFTSIVPSICFDQLSRKREFEAVKNRLKLDRIQIGSAPVVVSDAKKFMKIYGIRLYQGYGQTETALRVTGVPLDLNKKLYKELVEQNSIGKPMKWATVEIIDDKGSILGEKEEGELAVAGPAVMKGYLGNKGRAFKNGYFLTGDIGYYKVIGQDRYLFLKGRKKEIIIKGGVNISPVAIEDKLKKIESFINQVYVVGIPDRRFGEEIAAVVCWKKKDAEKAKARLKYKLRQGTLELKSYDTPQFIAQIKPEDLPMTSAGKVQRVVLKTKIPKKDFESIYLLHKTDNYSFLQLSSRSPYIKQAFDMYNYSWHPLTIDMDKFEEMIKYMIVIVAVDNTDKVQGMVCALPTFYSKEELISISYADLVDSKNRQTNKNSTSFICVAICGAHYKQEPIPSVKKVPAPDEVKSYLTSGNDSVYNFHTKAKGGLDKGAELIAILPNARPEDKMSLGYNMLMKYPRPGKRVAIDSKATVATQLIEVVLLLAYSVGIDTVYAFSRPAGLAKYFSK